MNFDDPHFDQHFSDQNSVNYDNISQVVMHLALCHTIIMDERTGKYNASSPDELALVNAAKSFGVEFKKRDEDNNLVVHFKGRVLKYQLLNILEFNSTRKRMSVIVRDPNNRVILLTKGADSVIYGLLNAERSPDLKTTQEFVDKYAEEGLRTLLLAQRVLTEDEYVQW